MTTTLIFDINQLPTDVLTFTDARFYDFVKEILGETEADLLKMQAINNVPSFLLTDDICGVLELDIDSQELDDLRKKISFRLKDGTVIVKAGVKSGDHKEFISNSIKKWVTDSKENLNFDELELKPDIDYMLNLTDNSNVIEGLISCKCGVEIKLIKKKEDNQQKQLSNNNNNTILPTTKRGLKRNSLALTTTSSQQSSTKRRRK
ncbi:unnamed protein product [Didymodactylos carnosus]|uniref:Uncharacterized protein n=1 Tax=Didymodactylos carnosus TaxID=1234261 RepID=A0A815GFK6_9BILA|nr:unnamed protein product [Didymodactylos carnosus]CAF1337781.1 unnamed protein product [Didymodactylos carnosus]CAF4000761.1 unnamed protein product [Didymodactylos carnosus]CAF4196463.1 unnamed protein product [Didymodactylos carnosus]